MTAALVAAIVLASSPAAADAVSDTDALARTLVANLAATDARVEAGIASEIEKDGYRVGLVLGPAQPFRPRTAGRRFLDPMPPDPALTFVGVVLREARTKRFLPAARVRVNLEHEGGGEVDLEERVGPYPVYGDNFRLPAPGPKGLVGITVRIGPPAYHRHAEMLGSFTGEAVVRFEVEPARGSRRPGTPAYAVKGAVRPAPLPADYERGSDLRLAIGEARRIVRQGEFLVGFVAEGPEPIWLWKGEGHPPECRAVADGDTHHFEAIVIHEPSGLTVPSASVTMRVRRRLRPDAPEESFDLALQPLLAEFQHYGVTAKIPAGDWTVTTLVEPPPQPGWGDGAIVIPEGKMVVHFPFSQKETGATSPAEQARSFAERLERASSRYAAGERTQAVSEVAESFLDFEGSAVDAALRVSDKEAYEEIEHAWIGVRARMNAGESPEAIGREIASLAGRLRDVGSRVATAPPATDASFGRPFVASFLLLLREGFEAILILGLVAAILRRTGKRDGMRALAGGASAALAASILLGLSSLWLFRSIGPEAREAFEGVTLLLAVAVLFVTSFWLVSRVEGRRWAQFVKTQLEGALTGERRTAVAMLAFLVVFREGAETVLFYAGLLASTPGGLVPIASGFVVAAVALAVIYVVSVVGGAKLPVRPFFAVSGALLYLLAFKFAGDGIHELQEAGWIPVSAAAWVPDLKPLRAWLGIRPTLETTLLQAALASAVVVGLVWTLRPSRASRSPGDSPGPSAASAGPVAGP